MNYYHWTTKPLYKTYLLGVILAWLTWFLLYFVFKFQSLWLECDFFENLSDILWSELCESHFWSLGFRNIAWQVIRSLILAKCHVWHFCKGVPGNDSACRPQDLELNLYLQAYIQIPRKVIQLLSGTWQPYICVRRWIIFSWRWSSSVRLRPEISRNGCHLRASIYSAQLENLPCPATWYNVRWRRLTVDKGGEALERASP